MAILIFFHSSGSQLCLSLSVCLSVSLIKTNQKLDTFPCGYRLFHTDAYMNQHTSITKHYRILTCTTWGVGWTRCTLSPISGGPGVLYHRSVVDQVYSSTDQWWTRWTLSPISGGPGVLYHRSVVDQVYSITDQWWTRCTLSLIITACSPV